VSHDKSSDQFKFGFKHLVRITIFFVVFFGLIYYFSSSKLDILGTTTPINVAIPPQVGDYINTKTSQVSQSSVIIQINRQKDILISELNGFPETQIKEIKKKIITEIYKDALDSIE
jgi:hypothetical protein